ncbi:LysR substrate-binding domain-containing protein [Azospirillum sp. sgz302134]
MRREIPLDLIRSFVAVADTGTVTRAADRVGRTQPAVSLQLQRLQDLVGRPLLERDGRLLRLTTAGELFLAHARRLLDTHDGMVVALEAEPLTGPVRIGVVQDVADTLLAGVLARFARSHPQATLEVQVAGSRALEEAVARGRLDLALVVSPDATGTDGEPFPGRRPMLWLGDPALAARDPLPLVLLDPPCRFRDAGLAALEAAGRTWRMAVTTPSLSGLKAAVRAGLGVTCRTSALSGEGIAAIPAGMLPPLPGVSYALVKGRLSAPADLLSGMIAEAFQAPFPVPP